MGHIKNSGVFIYFCIYFHFIISQHFVMHYLVPVYLQQIFLNSNI